jgi:toxin ParE1/3/4
MTGHVVKLPRALRDLDEAAAYIQRQSTPQRAIRFLRAADATFALLAGMPGMGTRYEPDEPIYAGLRYFPVNRHRKYLVFYRPAPGGIEVLRVLHGARDIAGLVAEEFGVDADADEGREEEPIEP